MVNAALLVSQYQQNAWTCN